MFGGGCDTFFLFLCSFVFVVVVVVGFVVQRGFVSFDVVVRLLNSEPLLVVSRFIQDSVCVCVYYLIMRFFLMYWWMMMML